MVYVLVVDLEDMPSLHLQGFWNEPTEGAPPLDNPCNCHPKNMIEFLILLRVVSFILTIFIECRVHILKVFSSTMPWHRLPVDTIRSLKVKCLVECIIYTLKMVLLELDCEEISSKLIPF